MQQPEASLCQRKGYKPTVFVRFLWWLSTAEPEIIAECSVDRNRYAITGMAVLGTWLFATLAWTYFFTTIVSSAPAAILGGLFMGGIILTIDRALIKGINTQNKRRFIPLAFRFLLALTIGTFMAQPALLYMFDKEIHVQVSLDDEQRRMDKQQQEDKLFAAQKAGLLQQKNQLQQQLDARYNEVSSARDAFIAETDGTGGSHKIGLKDIAQAKKATYEKLDAAWQQQNTLAGPELNRIGAELAAIDAQKQTAQKAYDTRLNDGFITRSEALQHIIAKSPAAAFRYYLLIVILVLIELMPVIAKTLLPNGTYDEKVRLREEMEKTIAKSNTQKEQELKELYNQTAFEQDSEFIRQFFDEAKQQRKQKMKQQFDEWAANENHGFDGFWEKVKRNMLTKQEN
jgi:hypothetical protein